MSEQEALRELHTSLDRRWSAEEVAKRIPRAVDLPSNLEAAFEKFAEGRRWYYSSMTDDFERPVGMDAGVARLTTVSGIAPDASLDSDNPSEVRSYMQLVGRSVGWAPGRTWRERPAESALGRRAKNRTWRALMDLEDKVATYERMVAKRRLVQIGRTGFACDITWEQFGADPHAACFVAYLAARRNQRRAFSLSGRDNPYDALANGLFQLLHDGSDWEMVAVVHPRPEVLARLSDRAKGELLGRWRYTMTEAATLLKRAWTPRDRTRMIVRSGDDSETWNAMAQAYNAARDGWLNCAHATGATDLVRASLPGKVMRLMAADLAWWHRSSGSDVDPDTRVWAELPLPWDVLIDAVSCTADDVERVCEAAGVDAAARGWTMQRSTGGIGRVKATPELVHGVAVADPVWAGFLRRAGVFSGKRIKEGFEGIAVPSELVESDLPNRSTW